MNKTKKRSTLHLTRTTIRSLTADSLRSIGGGTNHPTVVSFQDPPRCGGDDDDSRPWPCTRTPLTTTTTIQEA